MSEKSIKKNSVLSFIKAIVSLVFPLITFPYASRILGVERIGQVNFSNSIINYFVLLAGLGISSYAIREGAKIRDNKEKTNQFCVEIIVINLISTVISYCLLIIVMQHSSLQDYRQLMILSSITIVFNFLGINWLFNIFEEFAYITIRTMVMQIISLIILFLFVRTKDDYLNYAFVLVLSSVGANIFNISYSRKFISISKVKKLNLTKHIKPIMVIFGMTVASTIYLNLDTTMLGFMVGDYEVGIYSAATKINKIAGNLISSVLVVFLPRLSYYVKMQKKKEFNALVDKALNYILGLTIPASIGLFLLSKEIIILFSGSAFLDAVPTMMIKSPNIILSVLNGFIAIQLFMPLNKELTSLYATVAGAVINLVFNYLLIPIYGSTGAAVATLLAEGIVLVICLYTLKDLYSFKNIWKEILKYFIAGIGMIPLGIILHKLKLGIFSTTIFMVIGGGVIYFVLLFIMKSQIIIESNKVLLSRIKKHSKVEDME